MEDERNAFYVVRKGDMIGIYKSFSDCQAQAGSSISSPSVSIFKGYGLPKEAEEHLVSHGLKNADYTISAQHVQNDLFGKLVPCPAQQPSSSRGKVLAKGSSLKRTQDALESYSVPVALWGELIGATSMSANPQRKLPKSDQYVEAKAIPSGCSSCVLQFDGASKGNPGPAGAGAVLRADDGSMVWRLREGLGTVTNNVAEYRAVILGLKCALRKGFKHISVQGDSNLVCMQIQGLWKIKNQNMADLCKEAKLLKDQFASFQIKHVLREFNSEADAQANLAINLNPGQIEEDCN